MRLTQICKEADITVQQCQKWMKRARDAKCEYLFITYEEGDSQPYPYHISKIENIGVEREYLDAQNIKILLEVMI